jgi:hypothetical protein
MPEQTMTTPVRYDSMRPWALAPACLFAFLALIAGASDHARAKQGPGDRWAAIAIDGTIGKNKGAVFVGHPPDTNTYVVSFDRPIVDCIYLATITSGKGMITTALAGGDPTGVFVETYNATGGIAPRDFILHVVCD